MITREDRRSTPRIAFAARALVHLGDHHLTCETIDLGADGVFVLSPVHARAGLNLSVELLLPRLGRIRLNGVIVREGQHDSRYGWGITFINTPPATRSLLADFVLFELRDRREGRGSSPATASSGSSPAAASSGSSPSNAAAVATEDEKHASERSLALRASLSEEIVPELGEPRIDEGVYLHVRPVRAGRTSDAIPRAQGDSVGVSASGRSPSAIHRKSVSKRDGRPSKQHGAPPARAAAAASSRSEASEARRRRRREPTAEAPATRAPTGRTRERNAVYQRAQARARARAASDPALGRRDGSDVGRSSDRRTGEPSAAVREAQEFLDRLERGE